MDPADIRRYVERDWAQAAEETHRYWAQRDLTPDEALVLGDALRQHVRDLRPDWPTPADRRADLESHIRLSKQLARVRTSARPS